MFRETLVYKEHWLENADPRQRNFEQLVLLINITIWNSNFILNISVSTPFLNFSLLICCN